MSSAAQKRARKTRRERDLNQQAEGVAGLSPLVGVSSEEFGDALRATTRQVLRQPLQAIKHGAGYASKLVDIVAGRSELEAGKRDRRFTNASWQESGYYRRLLQAYLALDESFSEWMQDMDLNELDEQKTRFLLSVLSDTLAPTNNLLGNPAALKKLRATRGGSLVQGMRHLVDDLRNNNGMPAQVDKSQYTVGENIATTPGAVVFRSELLELIQYAPKTPSVYQRPLLVVPPQINKFYVFDLSPEKSMFGFLVEQGLQVFAVSWRNPTPEQSHWALDRYITALDESVAAIRDITGQESINVMGACSGGITASILSSYLDQQQPGVINSLSLNVCVLSQRETDTEITAFASNSSIESARRRSQEKGVLDGKDLARVFNWMRPNDLIWNYVVNNYLMGNKPPAFDILYWNNDTTCLPAQLHSDFLDILQSDPLVTAGDLSVLDRPIDLQGLNCDKYLVAGTTDHITPWHACYRSTGILGGDIRFILSNSGHIQALVNPPGNPKATFFHNEDLPASHEEWLEGASQHSGSWWVDWAQWLGKRSGPKVRARKTAGNTNFPVLGDAPGTYVME